VETIREDKSHVRLEDPTRLIVHVVPEAAFLASKEFSAADLKRASQAIRPLGERNGNGYGYSRFNADGFLMYDGYKAVREYTQLYRNGMFEGVMAEAVFQHQERAKILRENWCEAALISALTGFPTIRQDACPGTSLLDVRSVSRVRRGEDLHQPFVGTTFRTGHRPKPRLAARNKDRVGRERSCEVVAPRFVTFSGNAAGLERSFSYDEQGNRKTGG